MKSNKSYLTLILVLIFVFGSSSLFGQVSMTVNSLADDEYAYAWDDPNTTEDESIDGICEDEYGRCTIRAAIDESNNMSQPLNLFFSVGGLIDLIDVLYLEDGTTILGNNQIEISGDNCFDLGNDCNIAQLIFNGVTYAAITINGDNNTIGSFNVFINNYVAVYVGGNSNLVGANWFGIDENNNPGPNNTSILVTGSSNTISLNKLCSSITGISVAEGELNEIQSNYIGTNSGGEQGFGNFIGIAIDGSDGNLIGGATPSEGNIISGNSVAGISIGGVPPDSYSISNIISQNIIGLNTLESFAIPNGNGVVITNATKDCLITNNIITGNTLSGIHIFGYDEETKTIRHIITNNKIGINKNGVNFPNGQNGINIWGNVEDITIGSNYGGMYTPNVIVGNQGYGIYIADQFGFNPSKITARKNLIYQNNSANLFVSPLSNDEILPPYSLTFSNNTVAGIHDIPGANIDVYRSNINEFPASAYEWLGSTTVAANGVFTYEIFDPAIEAISVTATTSDGNTTAFSFLELITDVEKENDEIPTEFSLAQNYPNPFNPSTTITFSIPNEEFTSLNIFNSLGEEVAELVNETKPAGNYSVSFDASQLSSGVYFYQLRAGNPSTGSGQGFVEIKKMMLIK